MSLFETLQDFWDSRDLRKIRDRRRKRAEKFLEELKQKSQLEKEEDLLKKADLADEFSENQVVSLKEAKKDFFKFDYDFSWILKKINFKVGLVLASALCVLFLFLLIILLSSDIFAVKSFELTFNKEIQIDEAGISKSLQPFINRNIFLLSLDKVKNVLLSDFSNIETVNFKKAYPRTIMVQITEFKPALILRQGELPGDEYLINQGGFVMAKRGYSGLNAEYVTVLSTGPLEGIGIGSEVFEKAQVDFIYKAENALRDKVGVPVVSVWWLEKENELHIWTQKYFKVMMTFDRPVEEQIQDMILALGNAGIKKSNFSYIDLRVKGKVFIKPR